MGFLRKIGRKIKKGIKKLFSSKIGSFIGSIALSMIMGPVISRAFNGIKGVFTGAAQKGTETLVQEGVQKIAVEEGTKEAVKTKVIEEGTKEAVKDVATKGIIDNTVTGTMEKVIADNSLTNDLLLQAQEGLKGQAAEAAKVTISDITIAKPSSSLGQEIRQSFADFGTGVREFAGDPLGKTKEFVGGDQFIPDVAKSVGTSLALGAIQGEPEQPFISGGVAPQPVMEPAQNAYVQTVQSQIPNFPVTNFQQLNQSLLYGTLSPQYLMGQAQYS
jgi:hypothetical protein